MTDSSLFDPNAFLDATTTEAATKRPLLDPGLYRAKVGEVKTNSGTIEKGDRIGQPWLQYLIPLRIEVPQAIKDKHPGYPDTVTMTYRAFANLTEDNKGLAWGLGKNRELRVMREATGLNVAGAPFAPRMFEGKDVQVQIKHSLYKGEAVEELENVFKV
jgi:hypothetical protein